MEAGISGSASLGHLAEDGHEFTRFLDRHDARQRVLNQFIGPETQEVEYRVIRLKDLAVEIGDEHGVRRVLDEAFSIRARLVQLAHVAQDADDTDRLACGIAQDGGVESRGDDFARDGARNKPEIARHTALEDLAHSPYELRRLRGTEEARQRLLEHLVATQAEQLGNRVIDLEDLAFQVEDENGVRGERDNLLRGKPRPLEVWRWNLGSHCAGI